MYFMFLCFLKLQLLPISTKILNLITNNFCNTYKLFYKMIILGIIPKSSRKEPRLRTKNGE